MIMLIMMMMMIMMMGVSENHCKTEEHREVVWPLTAGHNDVDVPCSKSRVAGCGLLS